MDTSTNRRRLPLPPLVIVIALLIPFLGTLTVLATQLRTSHGGDINGIALNYATHQMQWTAGPQVKSSTVIPLRDLQVALKRSASPRLQQDVNVADLIRRFGPGRRVTLVILTGVFNTLAPDEGIIVHADVAVLVDMRTKKGFFLTD